ncbi:hypothetical protein LTR99_005921 [Exophiala xenobiotica]|nr:hypothetical protein LTR41_006060 [Exophiala xenobiotica]KAK5549502.1 hypothetical protein LTR23_000610 [Chaetothyriales sp. CCFEE 6169]KAK5222909.1 hypothetical protein LTR72_005746 [Exophiala xenobiotica]KAK5275492.1 hypothetical protein LTR40_012942 [Exophiala xenobiotica]KAK5302964.1 hypothetical protein LTR99_005921 [Exophiala xenobiotica]
MAFCFVVGSKDFTSQLKGYEGITAQCHNCGNWSAHPIQSWDWFTFCFVPVIPLGGKHKDSQQGQGPTAQPPQQGPPQGWSGPPGQQQQQQQMRYQ